MAAQIERLQARTGCEIFSVDRSRISARHYVGTVGVGQRAIDILPKIDLQDDGARANLVHMLGVAGLVPYGEAGVTGLSAVLSTVVDTFLALYVDRLALEWRRGRITNYMVREHNRSCLRGKLVFAGQLRENLLHPERFYTRADEFLSDVPLSRLLKAGLDVCRLRAFAQSTRSDAVMLLADFADILDQRLTSHDLNTIQVDRRTERFAHLVTLAKLLLSGRLPDRAGQDSTYSLVFDMNVVFEQYIGRLLQRVASSHRRSVRLQFGEAYLLRHRGRPRFGLRPDIAVLDGNRPVCLLDTKWKRLDPQRPHEGVSSADMYQMYAYGKEYDCPVVILLYPQTDRFGDLVAVYHHNPGTDDSPRIEVRTVDVRHPGPALRPAVSRQLRHILDQTCPRA